MQNEGEAAGSDEEREGTLEQEKEVVPVWEVE